MSQPKRYTGNPARLYDFMDVFAVHCPKCDGRADITVPFFLDYKNSELKCSSCHFSEHADNLIRYRLSGKAKCLHCLEFLDLKGYDGFKNIPAYINVPCSKCQKMNKIAENWEKYYQKYNEEGILDPAFGLTLWYRETVKGNILWAFNLRHLEEINNYVVADLRERTTDKYKMTMVEKLPDFVKLAKNRDEVQKAIERMIRLK